MNVLYHNDEKAGVLKRSIVANTYLWLDSHGDVHVPGIFSKTIVDRKGRISHLHDHEFKLGAKVGRPMEFKEVRANWSDLGVSRPGTTYVLQMDSSIEKQLNEGIYREYLMDAINQHSVSMQYEDVAIAMNDKDYPDEYKLWQEIYPQLGNPEKADELGMFWVVRKARLFEVSAVLIGSNELTPTLGKKTDPMIEQYGKELMKSIKNSSAQSDKKASRSKLSVKELLKSYDPKKYL